MRFPPKRIPVRSSEEAATVEPEPMRALTVRAPWSWAIAHGGKDVENRSWQPPCWLDQVAIHAGARSGWDRDGENSLRVNLAWQRFIGPVSSLNRWMGTRNVELGRDNPLIIYSAIVAVAEVDTCHHDGSCYLFPAFHEGTGRCSAWAAAGQWHWHLANVRALSDPVPCKGMLGLWRLPEDVERDVRKQLEEQ